MKFFPFFRKQPQPRVSHPSRRTVAPQLETLESRVVPYAASGNLWPHPNLVTISFEPDGTNLGGVSSNLFAQFNAEFGSTAAWENVILRAAQTWAAQTNLNFAVVADNGADSGSGPDQQGDPGFGDIRIGGFNMQGSNALALGYMPPAVNNYSVAGDIVFNTGQVFNINGLDYDLYSVALHEFGHALGLDHSSTTSAVMYPSYQGAQKGLYADDIAGIRSIYSQGNPRSPDAFDAAASNGTFATASNITSYINSTTDTALLTGLDVTTTSDLDYYEFTVPQGEASTAQISVQSQGLSLLAPSLRVYNGSETLVTSATGSGELGSTLTVSLKNVTAGQVYYIRVAPAVTTVFGVGSYALGLNLTGNTAPTAAPPNTVTANGNPLNGGGGVANRADSNGVSIDLLLGQTLGTVQYTAGSLGLGILDPTISGLGGLLAPVGSLVNVPYADLMVANPRPVAAQALATTGQHAFFTGVDNSALSLVQAPSPAVAPLISGVGVPLVLLGVSVPAAPSPSVVNGTPLTPTSVLPLVVPSSPKQPDPAAVIPVAPDPGGVDPAADVTDFAGLLPSTWTADFVFSSEELPSANGLEKREE